MKKINDKTKKWMTVVGLGVMCAVLVIAISFQFKTEKPGNDGIAPAATGQVNPSAGTGGEMAIPAHQPTDGTADPTDQPVQDLQSPVNKPAEPTESQKTAPSQKPSGEKVDKVQPTDHDSVKKPDAPQNSEPKGGERKDGQVYLPGFGWVTETGGSGTSADDMRENGNKIGIMD